MHEIIDRDVNDGNEIIWIWHTIREKEKWKVK